MNPKKKWLVFKGFVGRYGRSARFLTNVQYNRHIGFAPTPEMRHTMFLQGYDKLAVRELHASQGYCLKANMRSTPLLPPKAYPFFN